MTLWGETQLSSLSPFKTSCACACACDLWTSHHPIFRVQYAATLWQTIIKHDFTSHSSHSTIVVTLLYFIFTSIDSKLIYIREWKFSAYFVFYTRLFSLIKKSERGLAVVTLHGREPSKVTCVWNQCFTGLNEWGSCKRLLMWSWYLGYPSYGVGLSQTCGCPSSGVDICVSVLWSVHSTDMWVLRADILCVCHMERASHKHMVPP